MIELYNTVLYEPIFNVLIYLYHVIPGSQMGVAIILLTLTIKTLLFWPSLSALRAQKQMQDTQPMINALREKYKDDKEELGKQLMQFYKENKVNPFSSCLPILIQLPILLALYQAFFQGLALDPETHLLATEQIQHLYGFLATVYASTPIDTSMFGLFDLSKTHNIVLAVLAGLASYGQARTMQTKRAVVATEGTKDENTMSAVNKQMMYILPVMTLIFGYQFPAGVTLYWLVSTLFSLGQQLYFFRIRSSWDQKEDNENKPEATN